MALELFNWEDFAEERKHEMRGWNSETGAAVYIGSHALPVPNLLVKHDTIAKWTGKKGKKQVHYRVNGFAVNVEQNGGDHILTQEWSIGRNRLDPYKNDDLTLLDVRNGSHRDLKPGEAEVRRLNVKYNQTGLIKGVSARSRFRGARGYDDKIFAIDDIDKIIARAFFEPEKLGGHLFSGGMEEESRRRTDPELSYFFQLAHTGTITNPGLLMLTEVIPTPTPQQEGSRVISMQLGEPVRLLLTPEGLKADIGALLAKLIAEIQ